MIWHLESWAFELTILAALMCDDCFSCLLFCSFLASTLLICLYFITYATTIFISNDPKFMTWLRPGEKAIMVIVSDT